MLWQYYKSSCTKLRDQTTKMMTRQTGNVKPGNIKTGK